MLADWISIMDISAWFMLALPILPMMIPLVLLVSCLRHELLLLRPLIRASVGFDVIGILAQSSQA